MIRSSKLAMAVSTALLSLSATQLAFALDSVTPLLISHSLEESPVDSVTINGQVDGRTSFKGEDFTLGKDGDTVVIVDNNKKADALDMYRANHIGRILGNSISIHGAGASVWNQGSELFLGNESTQKIEISGGTYGILAVRNSSAMAHGTVEIQGDTLIIQDAVYGIHAQNNSEEVIRKDRDSATPSREAGTYILVNSKNTLINATSSGIVAFSGSRVDVMGNLTVNAPIALDVRGNSVVNINQTGNHIVQLNGDLAVETPGSKENSGQILDAFVNINLDNAQSYWNGNIQKSYPTSMKDPDANEVKNVRLALSNGAVWNPRVVEESQTSVGITKAQALNHLSLNGGIVNINSDDVHVQVENLVGSGQVNLATDGTTAGTFKVDQADANASLDVSFLDNKGNVLTSDTLTAEQAKALSANVTGVKNTTTKVQEGMYNGAIEIAPDGTVAHKGNTLMQSTLELALAAPLAMNRIMMNDVRKRLGDLRSVQDLPHGAWARYDGGKLSGNNGLQNEFNTIQVGADTTAPTDNVRVGVAFAYTKGDVDYARGSADMDAYSLSAYGVWFGQNGQFVDVVGRVARAETDMTVDVNKFGTAKNTAYSLSAEGGWRFDVMQNAYVEPQTELTYTYINAEDVNIGDASYEIDSVNSLMGRVGVAAGLKCPSGMGDVYVRASMVHEFLGDAEIRGANGTSYSTEGKDTWFEYGIGANFNVNKATYVYADVERTSGSALDEDWRANVGVRYSF